MIKLFLSWLLLTSLLFILGSSITPITSQFLYSEKPATAPTALWNRANFDGIHYLSISQEGYSSSEYTFFPLYPLLIRWLSAASENSLTVAVILSTTLFAGGLFVMKKLLLLDVSQQTTNLATALLLLFPTSFFFVSVYPTSLFFFLSILAFFLARQGRWLPASVICALATAAQPSGIFLIFGILYEWVIQTNPEKRKNAFPLLVLPLGLLIFMLYLYQVTGDPLKFIHTQSVFNLNPSVDIILPYQVIYRYFRMIVTANSWTPIYFTVVLEVLTTAIAGTLLLAGFLLKIRSSYLFYMFLSLLVPTLTGTLVSEPRFILFQFPFFLILAKLVTRRPLIKFGYTALSLIGLVIANLLFAAGYFVA